MIAVLSLIDLAVVVVVSGVILAGLYRTGRRIELKVGNVQATVDNAAVLAERAAETAAQAAKVVDEVNKAVNCRPPQDPTLYEQVRRIALKQDDHAATVYRIEEKTEDIGRKLVAHLAHHQAESDKDTAARKGRIDRRK